MPARRFTAYTVVGSLIWYAALATGSSFLRSRWGVIEPLFRGDALANFAFGATGLICWYVRRTLRHN